MESNNKLNCLAAFDLPMILYYVIYQSEILHLTPVENSEELPLMVIRP